MFQGYNKTDEFILTQHPLEETVEDFWRMVWDQNSSVIFLMTPADNPVRKPFTNYIQVVEVLFYIDYLWTI